jgi:DNA-binding helix-hairpin-helix protein with protein kinase domain
MKQFKLTHAGTNIRLGQEIGRGGEGIVFIIDGQTDRVAKLYLKQPDQKKIQKLAAMTAATSPALLRIAAWPTDLLSNSNGEVQGFVMPRIIARRAIHELYSPKGRSEAFPEADFRFLVHVGINIARAFAVIHEHGHVLGDVNHGNLLIGPDGTVALIDCDSFQIGSGTNAFTCDVGVPLFTAPELQGKNFRSLLRTANHDLFGLAVLLFHLLYIGRHPFAGRYSGPGDMPIEKAISEYRFAYGPDRAANGMEQPPGTISLETMGATVAQHFVRAFSRSGNTGGRPDAKSWVMVLEKLQAGLRICSNARWHHFPGELQACPWCALETQTSVRLFGQRIVVGAGGTVDVAALWQAIVAIPGPGADPVLPWQSNKKLPTGVGAHKKLLKNVRWVLSIGVSCSGFVACSALPGEGLLWALASYVFALIIWPWVSSEKRQAAERAYAAANTEWQVVYGRWRREASHEAFAAKLKDMESVRNSLTNIANERRRRMSMLEADREKLQRQRYLDRFRIDLAKISGIGPNRTAMLASFGIETANDIDANKIKNIPGFGDHLTSMLVAWRKMHEMNFRFNPNEPVDRRDIEALNRELEAKRQQLQTVLSRGPAELMRLSQEIIVARTRLMPMLEKAWETLKVSEAQRQAM